MPANEQLFDDLAGAVLDGAAVDWGAAASSADDAARPIIQHLRLVASVAQVHRDLVPAEDGAVSPVVDRPAPLDRWGHLRILDRIGRGAFGEVFRAWDTRLDREIALKLLPASRAPDSDDERSSIREGQLLARVRHPNVVTIYGAEQIGDQIGLWMELVRGHTLEQLLRQGTVFEAREVVGIGAELCDAVSAVHEAGLLHRDIKAHNVMRAEDDRVVLMDFGTGRGLDESSLSDLAGTPLYLAPEVLNGRPATVQSDIYSLGVLLYHLITGTYPVPGRTIRDVRHAHAQHKRVSIRAVQPLLHPAIARVIDRATDPLPEQRYESAGAMAADLAAAQHRPGNVLRYAVAAAAIALIVALAWEFRPRATGDERRVTIPPASLPADAPSLVERFRIAVLPFRNVAGESNDDLVDRITVSVIGQLRPVEGLRVRGPESSFRLKDKPRPLPEIGSLLNVGHVVRGEAQLSGGTLVLRASLVSVGDGVALWSGTIERRLDSERDIVDVVERLATAIAHRLGLNPGPAQRQNVTTRLDTFRKYLQAHELLDGRGTRAREAIPLYEEVIRAEPNYAPAWAELAATYGYLGLFFPDANNTYMLPARAVVRMEPLVKRALEIDPQLAEAQAAMGIFNAFGLRWTEAEASFRKAIELDPTSTHLYSDFVLSTLLPLGKLDEASRVMDKALEIDPLSLDARRTLSNIQLRAGRYSDALENCRRVLAADPNFPYAAEFCRWAQIFSGGRDEALAQFEVMGQRLPGVRGWAHAIKGERAEAEAIAAQFTRLPQRQAEIYGLMGDTDRALEALGRLALMNPLRAGYELTTPAIGLQADPRVTEFRRKNLGFPE